MHRMSGRLAEEQGFAPFDEDVVAAEASPKRVRARRGGRWLLDTDRALVAWIEGSTPDYAIPSADLLVDTQAGEATRHDRLGEVEAIALRLEDEEVPSAGVRVLKAPSSAQRLRDHVVLDWDVAEEWFVEDEIQRGHPRDPYRRIDVHASSRRIEVDHAGQTVAETTNAVAVFETGLPFRFYIPPADVRTQLLVDSSTRTRCAYKGQARWFHLEIGDERVEDAAWSYPSPNPGFGRLQDRICFDQDEVTMQVEGSQLV